MLNRLCKLQWFLTIFTVALLVVLNDIFHIDYEESNATNSISNSIESNLETSESSTSNLNDLSHHLVWFVQVSDLHISIYQDNNRVTDFELFSKEVLAFIKPKVILATGDLTDGKNADLFGSKQNEKEWKMYRDLVSKVSDLNDTLWFDVRGNHGNINKIAILT